MKFEHPILSLPLIVVGVLQAIYDRLTRWGERNETCYKLKQALRQDNKIYYVVNKYTNDNNVLRYYVDFFVVYDNKIYNADILLPLFVKIPANNKSKILNKGAFVFENMSEIFINKAVNNKMGFDVDFIQIDEDFLSEGTRTNYLY